MAIQEAQLEEVSSGLAPVSPGWFVINASDAAWVRNDAFGGRCVFEGSQRVLMGRPDVEAQMFPKPASRCFRVEQFDGARGDVGGGDPSQARGPRPQQPLKT